MKEKNKRAASEALPRNHRRNFIMATVEITAENFASEVENAQGKVLVDFWASWCGPCRSEMPDFNTAHEALGDQVQFLMVNMTDGSRETVETASKFIDDMGYSFPVLYDKDMDAANVYGVYSIPSTYFIAADGTAVARASGAIDADTLQKGIDMINTQS